MKSKNLAIILTGFVLIISYAIAVSHSLTELAGIVLILLWASFVIYALYYIIHDLIKLIRDE
jgi:uncharacterized membrane protein YjfL (UPF0719 family)